MYNLKPVTCWYTNIQVEINSYLISQAPGVLLSGRQNQSPLISQKVTTILNWIHQSLVELVAGIVDTLDLFLSVNTSVVSPWNKILALALRYASTIHHLMKVSFNVYWIMSEYWILSKAFSVSMKKIISFINMVYDGKFSNIKPTLHSWNTPYLVGLCFS